MKPKPPHTELPPRSRIPLRTWVIPLAVLIGGVLVTAIAGMSARRAERERVEKEFEWMAKTARETIQARLDQLVDALETFRRRHSGREKINAAFFTREADLLRDDFNAIASIAWLPEVKQEDEQRFIDVMRQELGTRFTIRNRPMSVDPGTAQNAAVDSTTMLETEHLYPATYVSPTEQMRFMSGINFGRGPLTARLIERARSTGKITASERLRPLTNQQPFAHFIVLPVPVPATAAAATDAPPAQSANTGVFMVRLLLDRILESSLATNQELRVRILVSPRREHTEFPSRLLLENTAAGIASRLADDADFAQFNKGRGADHFIKLADKTWLLRTLPTNAWLSESRPGLPWLIIGAGLLLSVAVAAFVAWLLLRSLRSESRAEKSRLELDENRHLLRSILSDLPGLCARWSAHNHRRPLFMSEGTEVLLGHSIISFIEGKTDYEALIHPDDRFNVRDQLQNALHKGQPFEFEYRIINARNQESWLLERGHGIYDNTGKLKFYDSLAIDITGQKRAEHSKLDLERQMLENQKLESLGLMASGIAHDFNNLLTIILGYTTLIELNTDVESKLRPMMKQIELSARDASELCQQLLAYAGKKRFAMQAVPLNELIQNSLTLLKVSLRKNIELRLHLSAEEQHIWADPTQIKQIIMNLVLNASDAIQGESGQIMISSHHARRDEIDWSKFAITTAQRQSQFCVLEITDNGAGMSEETCAKIFDPFFTTKKSGRGLGLAAVHGIIRAHHGGLRVRSQKGVGTTFTLYFPVAPSGSRSPRTPEAAISLGEFSGTALVIDDIENVRNATGELLSWFGFKVINAPDIAQAHELLSTMNESLRVVLLDLSLYEAATHDFRTLIANVSEKLPLIFMSGTSDAAELTSVGTEGKSRFLPKPFTAAQLGATLAELLAPANNEK